MLKSLKLKTEEQILTFSNLSRLFETQQEYKNDKILMTLKHDLEKILLKTTTCVDVMFRICEKDTPILRMYTYESFERDLNASARGETVPLAYFNIWKMYEVYYRSRLEPIYDRVLLYAQECTVAYGMNPNDPSQVEECIRLKGYEDFESLVIATLNQ